MVIPEEIEGYPVKEIYGIPDGVKALYIPDSVELINRRAFLNNEDLEYVYIGKNVKNIGDEAFSGCTNIRGFYIASECLEQVGSYAFSFPNEDREKVMTVRIPDTVTMINGTNFLTNDKKVSYVVTSGSEAEKELLEWQNYLIKFKDGGTIDYIAE